MFPRATETVLSPGGGVRALARVSVPLLPSHGAAEAVETVLGLNWKAAYLAAAIASVLAVLSPLSAQTPVDEESPWPRTRSANGHTVTVHLPQVETWSSNSFSARAVVEVKQADQKSNFLGVVWFQAHGSVDHSQRLVRLDRFEITKGRFLEAADQGSNALAVVRELFPGTARTVSLDYLVAALGFAQAAARQGPGGLRHTPPEIVWVTNRTVLVRIDGEPLLRTVPDTGLERVINTPAFLVRDTTSARFYLAGDGQWFEAASLNGPWALSQLVPAEVGALSPFSATNRPTNLATAVPRILVSTSPTELLETAGAVDFHPIRGTALQYTTATDSQLFFYATERKLYLLLSGRWFKADSLKGPWTHVPPRELPADFAKIPPGSPQAMVLAAVPDTREAEVAVLANSVPTTATINRQDATIELAYDGEPQFKTIEGTNLKYAVNAQLPVILSGTSYYALDNGVWFVAPAPTGPWTVAAEVPEEIYTIPPSSPVYYATYARVYEADDKEVEVGYTAGYQGAYEDDGTVVYGTGWDYEPWLGSQYYGWGWTWGYGYVYVPWYQWWVWRPWWTPPNGLRAAVIENIYDRWQGRGGILRPGPLPNRTAAERNPPVWSGHPALYGRHWPSAPSAQSDPSARSARSSLAAPQELPANTLALNPYARPKAPTHAGEIPRGAQLLSSLRQSGGGRDLFASPDGNIYQRRTDGWYRRQPGGGWSFFASTQGTLESNGRVAVQRAQNPGWNGQGRMTARTGRPGNRVPNSGFQAGTQEVAALERQYYARALAQYRAQNWRASGNLSRPVRAAGRRR